MKKNFRIVLALVLSIMMVLISVAPAFADGAPATAGTYTITVENHTNGASINGKTFTAYKLFESTYVTNQITNGYTADDGQAHGGDNIGAAQGDQNTNTTLYSQDDTPHAYYIRKTSPFFVGYGTTQQGQDGLADTTADVYIPSDATDTPFRILNQYFVFSKIASQEADNSNVDPDDVLVLVTPRNLTVDHDMTTTLPNNATRTFDALDAYKLAQDLYPFLKSISDNTTERTGVQAPKTVAQAFTATGDGDGTEKAVIDVSALGAGYYLVFGEGTQYAEGDEQAATGKTVAAAVALTTTDPKAHIIAKMDAPKLEKKFNQDTGITNNGNNPKYNNHAVGDTVPYKVEIPIPNMTGYEEYFYNVVDTMSAGLTLNDYTSDSGWINDNGIDTGFHVEIVKANGTSLATPVVLTRMENYTAAAASDTKTSYYVQKNIGDVTNDNLPANSFRLVFHDFLQYRGELITEENWDKASGWKYADGTDADVTQDMIGTYFDYYKGCKIVIKYSATVNDKALIGEIGNTNSAKLIYSNNPNENNGGKTGDKDVPNEDADKPKVTDVSNDSKTITYVTGLKVYKYTQSYVNGSAVPDSKIPLAHAVFTFYGNNIKNVMEETTTRVFKKVPSGETGDYYKLTNADGDGDGFTTDAPTADVVGNLKTSTVWDGTTEKPITFNSPIEYGTWRYYEGASSLTKTTAKDYYKGEVEVVTASTEIAKIKPEYVVEEVTSITRKTFRPATNNDSANLYEFNADGTYKPVESVTPDKTYVMLTNGSDDAVGDFNYHDASWNDNTIAQKEEARTRIQVETNASGYISFSGLEEGDYTLTEIKAPDGYNMLNQPINIRIAWTAPNSNTLPTDSDACTWAVTYKLANEPDETASWKTLSVDQNGFGLFSHEVLNNTGVELPSTGGIGTTIFYIAGSLMVLAAAILLITKRRMGAED